MWLLRHEHLERVAVSFSRGSARSRDQTLVSCIAGGFFITEQPGKALSPTTHPHVKQTHWFCFSEEPWLVQNLISFLLLPYWAVYCELKEVMNRKAYSRWITTVLRTMLNTCEDSWKKPEHRFIPYLTMYMLSTTALDRWLSYAFFFFTLF